MFVIAETLLAVLIHFVSGSAERIICFSTVLIACLFSLLFSRKNICGILTLLGLIFTVCADVFLVLMTDGDKLFAMYFFAFVQLFYFLRVMIEHTGGKIRKVHLTVRIELLFLSLILTCAVLGDGVDKLSVVSMLYFTNLLVNIVFSFFNFKRAPMLAIGLLLFAFCDIFVGFSMLDLYIPISESSIIYKLSHTGINLIWLFYVPSQTLIALSSRYTKK